jgi:hypothetical protein
MVCVQVIYGSVYFFSSSLVLAPLYCHIPHVLNFRTRHRECSLNTIFTLFYYNIQLGARSDHILDEILL